MRDPCSTVLSQANDHAVAIKPRRRVHIRRDYRHTILQAANSNVLLAWSDSRLHDSRRAEYQFDPVQCVDAGGFRKINVVADQYADLVALQLEDRVGTPGLSVLPLETEQVDLELSPNNLPVFSNHWTAESHVSLDLFIERPSHHSNSVLLSQRLQARQRTHRRRDRLFRQPMFRQTDDVHLFFCGFLRELHGMKDSILYRRFDRFDLYCCGSDDLLRH